MAHHTLAGDQTVTIIAVLDGDVEGLFNDAESGFTSLVDA
jgi:hypothetical protein